MTDQNKVESQEPESKIFRKTTLGELGAMFPVLPHSMGKPSEKRDFSFREWDMDMEEKLSTLKSESKNIGEFVNKMFCALLDQFCGQDFQKLTIEQRMVAINQMEFPNVMYAYIYLRVEELGHDLRLNVTCPSCGKLNADYVADLRTLEVRRKELEHARAIDYVLTKPLILEDGKIITSLKFDVAKWEAMESATQEIAENSGKMKRLMLKSSLVGASTDKGPVEGFYDPQAVLSKLKKVDIEKVLRDVTENNAGPHMAISGKCVHCKKEFQRLLDWSYDVFFDSSSL